MAVLLPTRRDLLSNMISTSIADLPGDLADLKCAICFGTLSDSPNEGESEQAVVLHKTHYYGEQCIRAWLDTNDSCPLCRQEVHSGTFGDAISEAEEMDRRLATSTDPIDDREVLALLLKLDEHQNSERFWQRADDWDQLRRAKFVLMWSRRCRFERNPALLILPKFYPHEPDWSRSRLEREQWDELVQVQSARTHMSISDMFESYYRQGLNRITAPPEAYVEVALHPLARKAYRVLMTKLLLLDSKCMTIRALHASLIQALEGEECLQDLMDGKMFGKRSGSEALMFLYDFVEDIIRRLLLQALLLQGEKIGPNLTA